MSLPAHSDCAFAINHLGTCGGVQVTASHNGPEYNGFKISGLGAKPIGADTGLKEIRHIATALLHTKARLTGSVEKYDLTEEYKNHVLKFLEPDLRRIKIVIDASSCGDEELVEVRQQAVFKESPISGESEEVPFLPTFNGLPGVLAIMSGGPLEKSIAHRLAIEQPRL